VNNFHLLPCFIDRLQRRRQDDCFRLNLLQQSAFECPAPRGPVSINPAERSIQTRAGLQKTERLSLCLDSQANGSKLFRIIGRLQFDIAKQNAIATKPTLRTKLRDRTTAFICCFCHADFLRF